MSGWLAQWLQPSPPLIAKAVVGSCTEDLRARTLPMAFLTTPAGHRLGEPVKACACKCDRPMLLDGSCHRCGHFTISTIERTWRGQRDRRFLVGVGG